MQKLLLFSFAIALLMPCFIFGQGQIRSEINDNRSQDNQNQANQTTTPTEVPKTTEQPSIEQPKAEETDKQSKSIQTVTDWAMWSAVGTLLSAIISVIVLFVIVRQVRIYNKQLREMKRQADTMNTQAETMTKQFGVMEKQSETMQTQAKVMEDTLEETRNIIKQNERAIEASQRQAKSSEKSLEMSEELFYISERAYIGIEHIQLKPLLNQNQPSELIISVINTGKTPAWDVSFNFAVTVEMLDDIKQPDFANFPDNPISVELLSGVKSQINTNEPLAYNNEAFEAMINKTAQLAIYIQIRYKCIQDRQEANTFKYIYTLNPPRFHQLKS